MSIRVCPAMIELEHLCDVGGSFDGSINKSKRSGCQSKEVQRIMAAVAYHISWRGGA